MTLIELMFLFFAVVGALAGSVFGWQSYGVLGVAGGALVGVALAVGVLTLLLALVGKLLIGGPLGRPQKP